MRRQTQFQKTNWAHRFSYGGTLRTRRLGRGERPLSTKEPIHLVFKANTSGIRGGLQTPKRKLLIESILKRYSKRFAVKIEMVSVQFDHIHIVARLPRRSNFQNFMRVFAGQVAQRFLQEGLAHFVGGNGAAIMAGTSDVTDTPASKAEKTKTGRVIDTPKNKMKLWKHRPFTRVVRGYRAYRTVCDYVRLNELEVIGKIPYRKERLKGLLIEEWKKLWSQPEPRAGS